MRSVYRWNYILIVFLSSFFSSYAYSALEDIKEFTADPDGKTRCCIDNIKAVSSLIGNVVAPDERYAKPVSFSLRYENISSGVVRIFVDEQDTAPLMRADLIKILYKSDKASHIMTAKSYTGESQLISRAAVLTPVSVALQNKGIYSGWIVRTGGNGYLDVDIAALTASSISGDRQKGPPEAILVLKVISVPESKIMRLDISSGYAKEVNEKNR